MNEQLRTADPQLPSASLPALESPPSHPPFEIAPEFLQEPHGLASEVLNTTTDAVYVLDFNWRFIYLNPVALILVPGGASVLGRNVWDVFPEAVDMLFWHEYHRTMDERVPTDFAIHYGPPVNGYYDIHTFPTHQGMGVSFRNITESHREQERLRLLEQAVYSAPVGISISTHSGTEDSPILFVNPAFEQLTGYASHEVVGRDCRFLQGLDRDQEGRAEIKDAIELSKPAKVLLRNYKKSGRQFYNELHLTQVFDAHGKVTHLVCIQNDVTEQLEIKETLARQAQFDALTGIANRYLLIERLRAAIETARLQQTEVAVIILDLDNFKHVNDKLGHMDADHLLVQISRRLSATIGPGDTVARLGGDEFALVLTDCSDRLRLIKLIDRLLHEIRQPVHLPTRQIMVTGSAGVALYPQDAENADELLLVADLSMYTVKRSGKNSFCFYSPAFRSNNNEPLDVAVGLRGALVNREFQLFYQPRVSATSNQVVGVEALIRWHHPTRGMLMPAQFIAIAEDTGIINDIGQWALAEALAQNAAWRKAGLRPLSVSVNVSPAQIRDPRFSSIVAEIVTGSGLPPESLEIELTESLLIDHADVAQASLSALRQLGVKVAIDDFGSGYSGLHYLTRFPIDTIKIDHFFIRNIAEDKAAATICRSVLDLGRDLGLTTVAEGVETATQAELLSSWQCNELQGNHFSSPIPGKSLEAFLTQTT